MTMRGVFAFLLLVHAAIHLLVFLSVWRRCAHFFPSALRRASSAPYPEPRALALAACWLALGAALVVAAATALSLGWWWPAYTVLVLACSLLLTVVEWDAVPAAPLGALLDATLIALLWTSHLLDLML